MSEELLDAMDALREARASLEMAMMDVETAIVTARLCDGEVERVVAGQLDAYTFPALKTFFEEGFQPGNLPSLMEIVRKELESQGVTYDERN